MNNNNPRMLHETILKDIMDVWDGVKDLKDDAIGKLVNNKNKVSSSIAKSSSNLNLVFPVICSKNISIENASMISKALEKNAVTMLQRLFACWQVADSENVESVQDYINQFHSNLSSRAASLDDLFELTGTTAVYGENSSIMQAIKNDLGNLNYYLPTSISENALTSFKVEGAVIGKGKTVSGNILLDKGRSPLEIAAAEHKDGTQGNKNAAEFFGKQVLDSDYKKANELMPTTMVINFKVKDSSKEGKPYNYENAVIGVKAKLYPIGSDDIVKHISDKNGDKNWLTNFFRATTREISFMKDFVLALDKAKIDALSLSTRRSSSDRMWKVLERRATVSRIKKAMRHNTASVAAITTLVVSQEEVEYMRKNYNVDLEKVPTVLRLFDSYNLMAVVIVDESLEVAKFIYDEAEPMWETISFTHLERESSDNTYKRVVNLMTKIS